MTRRKQKEKETPKTNSEPKSKWSHSGNGTKSYTAKNGTHYVALKLDDDSYSVTVCASKNGPALHSLRVPDDADLDALIG